jgi:hypothetical protein
MPESQMPLKWYYRAPDSGATEGPFDFLEIAGLLRTGVITPETLTREGALGDWRPFREQRSFGMAKDMPPGVIVKHLDQIAGDRRPFNPFRWSWQFLCLCFCVAIYTAKVWFWSHFPYAHQQHDANDWLMLIFRWLSGHNNPPH